MSNIYTDIDRYLQLTNQQLNYVLAAWCQYRSADAGLVDLLVAHVEDLDKGQFTDMKKPYFDKRLQKFPWVGQHPHHVKAITVASCKYQSLNHPDLVKQFLRINDHITLNVLNQTIAENRTDADSSRPNHLITQ